MGANGMVGGWERWENGTDWGDGIAVGGGSELVVKGMMGVMGEIGMMELMAMTR